ncbi:CsbD family protein [Schaalia sp. ZJ405]|uniref:CsbD family protein n=1 Tax=unclassified Schaalia TaxID=2691889 RepID=UPI0013EC4328|nr:MULTISPECIES: CsbD family protein [unclassified Schaalia]QPK80693.1 CsbD family protein [Schaalia sp. ZJ405]
MADDNGVFDKVAGKVKETAGKITGDSTTEADGKLQQAEGKAKEILDDVKGGIEALGDRVKDALDKDDK